MGARLVERWLVTATIERRWVVAEHRPIPNDYESRLAGVFVTEREAALLAGYMVSCADVRSVTIMRTRKGERPVGIWYCCDPTISQQYWASDEGDWESGGAHDSPAEQWRRDKDAWDACYVRAWVWGCSEECLQWLVALHLPSEIPGGNAPSAGAGQ